MIQDDQTWAAQAACATVEPDQLFGKGAEQRDARSLCFACPVRMECLAEALNSESSFGVWGGLTERERRALLRRFPEVDDWGLWLEREDDELVVLALEPQAPVVHLGEAPQQRPPLPLGQPAPDAEAGLGVERLGQALHTNRTCEAQ